MRKSLVLLAALTSPLAAQGRTLVDLHWLAGCWERARPASRMVELWTPAVNNVMTGTSYSITDTSQRELEQLRLFARGDTLIYEAHPSTQRMNEFKSTKITAQEIVFEDPEHDFPQKITYRRVGADSLIVVTEGDRAGRAQPVTFAFRKAPCGKLGYSPTASTRMELQRMYDTSREAGFLHVASELTLSCIRETTVHPCISTNARVRGRSTRRGAAARHAAGYRARRHAYRAARQIRAHA